MHFFEITSIAFTFRHFLSGPLANNSCCTTSMRRDLLLPLKGRFLLSLPLCFGEAVANASVLTDYTQV
jgi:hypothetical protein